MKIDVNKNNNKKEIKHIFINNYFDSCRSF